MQKKIWISLLCFCKLFFCWATDTTSTTILFKYNKYSLTQEAKIIIQNIQPTDTNYIINNVKIYGHTDQIGSHNYNNKLSYKRANAVKDFLLENGIQANVINPIKGKGKKELVIDKMDALSRQQNRRVIITFEYTAKTMEPTPKTKVKKDTVVQKKEDKETLTKKIRDTSVKVGDNLVLKDLNFYGSRHILLRQSYQALNELLEAMQNIPTLIIKIEGHICCTIGEQDGIDADYNTQDLSVRRAEAVYNFLVSKGIAPNRMSYEGFGHKYPLTKERDDVEKMMNRRVEIKILKK